LQLNKNLPIFAANQSFNMQLKTLSFLLLANLVGSMAQAQSFQHSLGLSFNQMQYQRYSFQQYSQTRPPHVVTPMKEYNPIIPVRYHLRWGLGKRKEGQKLMLELNFPIDVALFATTDELKKADNFMMLHLPVLLGVCYGDRTKYDTVTKNQWGAYAAVGASLTKTTGFLGKKSYFSPCGAIGIRKNVGRTLIDFAYSQTYMSDKVTIPEYYSTSASTVEDYVKRDLLKYVHHLFSLSFTLRSKKPNS
jgi:hypothetical protein